MKNNNLLLLFCFCRFEEGSYPSYPSSSSGSFIESNRLTGSVIETSEENGSGGGGIE